MPHEAVRLIIAIRSTSMRRQRQVAGDAHCSGSGRAGWACMDPRFSDSGSLQAMQDHLSPRKSYLKLGTCTGTRWA